MINDFLIQLSNLSVSIGSEPAYIQGGGGNTSVKSDDGRMFIKASGFELKNVTPLNGFACVDLKLLNNYLASSEQNANIFTKNVELCALNGIKPSIETGLHACLPQRFVLHSHSVYTNILNCSKEGEFLIKNLFPSAIWINYANPGAELINLFFDSIKNNMHSKYIFLQNHGFITTGDTVEEVIYNHSEVNNIILNALGLTPFNDYISNGTIASINTVFFPDQAVYLSDDSLFSSEAAQETLKAYDYIFSTISDKKLTPTFIPYEKVLQILNMDAEKYRKNLILNKK